MAAGLLLPPYSKFWNGRKVAALLRILLLDFALRKGLLRGRSLWGKCQNPCTLGPQAIWLEELMICFAV